MLIRIPGRRDHCWNIQSGMIAKPRCFWVRAPSMNGPTARATKPAMIDEGRKRVWKSRILTRISLPISRKRLSMQTLKNRLSMSSSGLSTAPSRRGVATSFPPPPPGSFRHPHLTDA